MLVKLVFEDWRQIGEAGSVYSTELGLRLSSGDMHSGTTWSASLECPDIEAEIREAWEENRAYPVFRVIPINP